MHSAQVTANGTHNTNLLEAMRGAGTVFGVVVELTLKLHDVSDLYGGFVVALDDSKGSNFKCASLGCPSLEHRLRPRLPCR